MDSYLNALKKYADFDGRARRKEYWMFCLMQMIVFAVLTFSMVISVKLGIVLVIIFALGTYIPTLAITVRRLHDTGRSGWWYLIQSIPYIGGIWLFVLLVLDSQSGPNQYGMNPKENNDII